MWQNNKTVTFQVHLNDETYGMFVCLSTYLMYISSDISEWATRSNVRNSRARQAQRTAATKELVATKEQPILQVATEHHTTQAVASSRSV